MRSWLAVKPQPALRGKNMLTLQKPANDACCRSMWSAASEGAASNTGVTRASFLPQPDPLRLTVAAPEQKAGEHKQDARAHSRLLHELTVPSSQSPTLRRHQGQGSLEHTPAWVLLGTGRYQVGRDGCSTHRRLLGTGLTRLAAMMLDPSDASRNRTLPDWHRWMLDPSEASRSRTLPGWQRWMLAPSEACRNRTLPGWQRWMLAPSDASRNRTLPGWQRWMLDPSEASRNRTLPGWQRWMLAPSEASRNRTLPGWQRWMPDVTSLAAMDARPIGGF